MTDDESLDLSAWQPPPAPDVTDAVIARIHGARAAVEPPPRARWWLLGTATIALAAGATALWLRSGSPEPAPPGELVATMARHVALDGASADVEAGATLRWTHDRDGLRVEQRGRATWTVGDRIRIDAGAGSIEATAANLRVEVEMNRQDLHVITTSAITAAAVALVTIIVYDGHVRATSAGQTVTLPPGTTFQIVPDHPPQPVTVVGAAPLPPEPPPPPAPPPPPPPPPTPSVEGDRMRTACLELQAKQQWPELQNCANALEKLDPARAKQLIDIAASELRSQVGLDHLAAAIRANDLPAAYASYSLIPLSSVYAATAMKRYAPFETAAIERLVITARELVNHGKCTEVDDLAATAGAPAATNAIRALGCKRDPLATRDGSPPSCNLAELVARAENSYASGNFAAALAGFETAYRCQPSTQTLARAYVSACKTGDAGKARALFVQLPTTQQENGSLIQVCLAVGVDPRKPQLSTKCQPGTAVDPYSREPLCGTLVLRSIPSTLVWLDGISTNTQTPMQMQGLVPGKHKVTLQAGGDKFTFTVAIEAGQTTTLSKQLQ